MENKKFNVKKLAVLGLLIAVHVVLSRFCSINAWNMKIGFAFLPIFIAAVAYGPIQAGIVGALGDFIGAILFPIGPYFPGFTLSCFLTGIVYGLFLHKKQTVPRIVIAALINQWILSLFLTTFWISVLYKSPYGPLLVSRIIQCAILTAIEIVVMIALSKTLLKNNKNIFE